MSVNTQSRFDGIVDRGSIIFENQVKAQVAGLDPQAFIAIDVDSGDFEVATEDWMRSTNFMRAVPRPSFISDGSEATLVIFSGVLNPHDH